jgi:hypothetical protein
MAAKQKKTDENDFAALDRMARAVTPEKLRPMTAQQRATWQAAKIGRPKKPRGTKSVPTLITVEPQLLRQADAYAKRAGLSRSQLFSDAVPDEVGRALIPLCGGGPRPAVPAGHAAHTTRPPPHARATPRRPKPARRAAALPPHPASKLATSPLVHPANAAISRWTRRNGKFPAASPARNCMKSLLFCRFAQNLA